MSVTPKPGEFGVVRTKGFIQVMIRVFTRSQVNHAFIVCEDGHTIIEAQTKGAVVSDLSKWEGHLVVFSAIGAGQPVIDKARTLIGTPYNFLDIFAIGLRCLGLKWGWVASRAEREDRLICSQLVDRAFHLAGHDLFADGRPDGSVTPGDLLLLIAEGVPTHTADALV